MIGVNLLPVSRQRARAARRRTVRWAVVVGVYGAVIVPAGFVLSPSVGKAAREVNAQIEAAGGRIERAEAALRELRPLLQRTRSQLEATRSVCEHADWSVLLALLAAYRGEEIGLDSCEITGVRPEAAAPTQAQPVKGAKGGGATEAPPISINVTGYGVTPAAVTTYALRLEEAGVFGGVRIVETSPRDVHGVPATWFRIRCTLMPVPAASTSKTMKGKP